MNNNTEKEAVTRADRPVRSIEVIQKGLGKRYRKERRFRIYGLTAVVMSMVFLAILFVSISFMGFKAFEETYVRLDIFFDPSVVTTDNLEEANYASLIKNSLKKLFPEVTERREKRRLYKIVSSGAAYALRNQVIKDTSLIGKTQSVWLMADDEVDLVVKGQIDRSVPEIERLVSDKELQWIDRLAQEGRLKKSFNTTFFTSGDSRDPEMAGVLGAAMGSLYTLLITLVLSFPIGVAAAVYLEEFAPQNRLTDIIEVNISNLAAVPSIIFGLLGLSIFLGFFGMSRSTPVVGGLVLTLMTLPTIVIASRVALTAVPPSIREAALGVGASRMQTVFHHVLPLALPGMLTGTIIGMARALGETAPLLMIGMVAFIVDVPQGLTDPATALPVQIYLWADSPERAFAEKAAAAIIVLLVFMVLMNLCAIILRQRFEKRW